MQYDNFGGQETRSGVTANDCECAARGRVGGEFYLIFLLTLA